MRATGCSQINTLDTGKRDQRGDRRRSERGGISGSTTSCCYRHHHRRPASQFVQLDNGKKTQMTSGEFFHKAEKHKQKSSKQKYPLSITKSHPGLLESALSDWKCTLFLPVNTYMHALRRPYTCEHIHTHMRKVFFSRFLASDKLLTHLSGCQCLESNYPTLFTQGALTQLSPRGGYIEGVLLLTTLSRTHTYTRTHTHS